MSLNRKIFSFISKTVVTIAFILTIGILITIVGYIFINGIPNLRWELIFGKYTAENPSMAFAIVTTLLLIILALIFSVPISICCAVYLTEYAKRGNKLVKVIRLATETLAGIPSIIYGLFGALFFGETLGMGYSILNGALTVSIMLLPVIIRTSEEAISSVPDSYREGSFGLGAGKLYTLIKIILPSAAPGIFSAIILSIGRIVGETAALIFTLGSVAKMPTTIMDSSRTLAIHMYISTRDGGTSGRETAFACGVILISLVICINIISSVLANKLGGDKNEN